jgi:hypothetical protein
MDSALRNHRKLQKISAIKYFGKVDIGRTRPFRKIFLPYNPPEIFRFKITVIRPLYKLTIDGISFFKINPEVMARRHLFVVKEFLDFIGIHKTIIHSKPNISYPFCFIFTRGILKSGFQFL